MMSNSLSTKDKDLHLRSSFKSSKGKMNVQLHSRSSKKKPRKNFFLNSTSSISKKNTKRHLNTQWKKWPSTIQSLTVGLWWMALFTISHLLYHNTQAVKRFSAEQERTPPRCLVIYYPLYFYRKISHWYQIRRDNGCFALWRCPCWEQINWWRWFFLNVANLVSRGHKLIEK